jgi:hypothetical protein
MLNGQVFYHGIIRKTIISFGRLFSNIYIDRREGDSVTGNAVQRLQVPIAYAPKEKWIVRLEQDPNLENNTYTSLPRMSFEITGYMYDSQRKLGKMNKITCNTSGASSTTFTPVPYVVNISLYILTKTQEDALQIIEQILPTFGPEYTLAINAVPEMNIVQDIPIILNSVDVSDEYDGDFATRRFVTHTLTFTLKLNLFSNIQQGKQIYNVETGIFTTPDLSIKAATYIATVDPDSAEIIEDGWESF